MTEVRRIPGSKLLITKALSCVQKTLSVCEGLTAVADVPHLLEVAQRPAPIPAYAFTTTSTVLSFISIEQDSGRNASDTGAEKYIAGDPTGCIRVLFPSHLKPTDSPAGKTYVVTDVAIAVRSGVIYFEIIEGTRLLLCQGRPEFHVRRDNDVSRNCLCEVQHNERSDIMQFIP
ncbi:hypothetical protein, conserved [Babesia bigemina]|uniref:Uncharacterized protein n=1 Tax=Babesia bigemina TaxID=5866 RepID=A0A061DAL4_BABBI|nr:hypothetical protein, conserved [Babesia bigemina]CDR97593.1 hypothetical protein, conserved [Babesia bigemina]|eukprot:XP_012769779.1 hypothetical protein, conserved [Babesia bigemina]